MAEQGTTGIDRLFAGAYGVFAMFYFAGISSIPRRYAIYPAELAFGQAYAAAGAAAAGSRSAAAGTTASG